MEADEPRDERMTGQLEEIPLPLVPADVDLRDFSFTPMFRARLFSSEFHAHANDAEWRAGVTLWLKSWDQVPAGTLPENDMALARLAEFGRDIRAWREVKARALHGWRLCTDGRLHHAVVAEGVLEAWSKRKKRSARASAGAAGKWKPLPGAEANRQTRAQRLAAARQIATHTAEEWEAMLDICGPNCLRCGAENAELVKDHIIPIYQGGSDGIENLQPLCRRCNAQKGPENEDFRQKDWAERLLKCLLTLPDADIKCLQKRLLAPAKRQGQGERQGESKMPAPRGAAPGGAKAKIPSPDDKTWLFNEGLELLASMTGKPAARARSLIGKWSKALEDNHASLRAIFEQCAQAQPIDPVPWITAAVATRKTGQAQLGIDAISDESWGLTMQAWRRFASWNYSDGPNPDQTGTSVPERIRALYPPGWRPEPKAAAGTGPEGQDRP